MAVCAGSILFGLVCCGNAIFAEPRSAADPQNDAAEPYDSTAAFQADIATLKVGRQDWPQWGGSRGRNNTPLGKDIPIDWDVTTGRNIKWSVQLGTQTYGNPSVANGKLLIGTNNGAGYLKRYPPDVDLGVLLCFDEKAEAFLWQLSREKLPVGRVQDWPLQGLPSTPLVDGDRLWVTTNRGEVMCLDLEGFRDGENDGPYRMEQNENPDEADIVWAFDMIGRLGVSPHNMSNCSPICEGDLLFICTSNGVGEGHTLIPAPGAPSFMAMNRWTGEVVWTDNSPGVNILHGQWCSPTYAVLGGHPQVIFGGGDGWLYSFDPKGNGQGGGALLWKFDCNPKAGRFQVAGRSKRNSLIGFASVYDGLVYIAVGEDPEHGVGDGHLWCIDPTRRGDVSPELAVGPDGKPLAPRRFQAVVAEEGEMAIPNPNSAVVWHYDQRGNAPAGAVDFEDTFHRSISTATIKDNLLYIPDFSGLFHCLDAETGQVYWTHDLLASCWGSALVVDDKVYVGDEDGKVTIFRHGSSLQILAEVEMGDSVYSPIYSTPTVANDVLFIATRTRLYAIGGVAP